MLVDDYDMHALDHEEIYKAVSDGVKERRIPASAMKDSIEENLMRLQLLKNGKLNKAAVALFSKEIALNLKSPPALRTLRDDLFALKSIGLIELKGYAKTAKWTLTKKKISLRRFVAPISCYRVAQKMERDILTAY